MKYGYDQERGLVRKESMVSSPAESSVAPPREQDAVLYLVHAQKPAVVEPLAVNVGRQNAFNSQSKLVCPRDLYPAKVAY